MEPDSEQEHKTHRMPFRTLSPFEGPQVTTSPAEID